MQNLHTDRPAREAMPLAKITTGNMTDRGGGQLPLIQTESKGAASLRPKPDALALGSGARQNSQTNNAKSISPRALPGQRATLQDKLLAKYQMSQSPGRNAPQDASNLDTGRKYFSQEQGPSELTSVERSARVRVPGRGAEKEQVGTQGASEPRQAKRIKAVHRAAFVDQKINQLVNLQKFEQKFGQKYLKQEFSIDFDQKQVSPEALKKGKQYKNYLYDWRQNPQFEIDDADIILNSIVYNNKYAVQRKRFQAIMPEVKENSFLQQIKKRRPNCANHGQASFDASQSC